MLAFRPRSLQYWRQYGASDFRADLSAGLTVGIVALPLAMAFGIASGARPEQGLATAIIGGFLISALGGSRVQIGGPAGAFVALLFGISQKYGVANMLIAGMMAGVLLIAMGAFRLGNIVRYVPVSIITGFTAGIAVMIGLSQLKDALGLTVSQNGAGFITQMSALIFALPTINLYSVLIALSSLLLIALWPVGYVEQRSLLKRLTSKLPSTLLVIIVWSALTAAFHLPVETIGSRFGELPSALPMPAIPSVDWHTVQYLASPAIAIALLCAIESLLCARLADSLLKDRHDSNQELMAQGIANIVAPWFGGIAATGTVARTVTNIRAGARTPVAGMIHALVLLVIVLLAAPLAKHVPLAALAAVLLWVAYSMGDWRAFSQLRQYSNFYRATMLSTFIVTVVFDVVAAVEVGLVLASLFFIMRMSSLTRVEPITVPADVLNAVPQVQAHRLFGALFFGSVDKIEQLSLDTQNLPDVLILEAHQLISLDTTGLDAIEQLHSALAQRGGRLVLVGLNEQPRSLLERSHFAEKLGPHNLLASLDDAYRSLREPSR